MARPKREYNEFTGQFADTLYDLILEKKENGYRHNDIAKGIGVSSATLSDWAGDKKTPTIDYLYKIAKYFDVSADYLLGFTGVRSPETSVRAMCQYTGLSEDALSAVVGLCQSRTELRHKEGAYSPRDALNYFLEWPDLNVVFDYLSRAMNLKTYVESGDVDSFDTFEIEKKLRSTFNFDFAVICGQNAQYHLLNICSDVVDDAFRDVCTRAEAQKEDKPLDSRSLGELKLMYPSKRAFDKIIDEYLEEGSDDGINDADDN